MRIKPAKRIRGQVRMPGDKSISHRAALIAGLAAGQSNLTNFSTSQDCASTLSALRQLGISVRREGNSIQISTGPWLKAPAGPIDCGNSGSTMRMFAGILAGLDFVSILTGDESLRSRPMERIITPLRMMGARVSSESGRPPLRIEGHSPLIPIEYELPIASAQVKTCILLAGLLASGPTTVIEKVGSTRDHTERLLRWFGVLISDRPRNDAKKSVFTVLGPARFGGCDVSIPGDFSAATFLIAAASLLPDSDLQIDDLGLNPSRTQFLETLRSVGARIEVTSSREECNEPVGSIRIRSIERTGVSSEAVPLQVSGELVAAMIDELPLLAVVGTQLPGGLVIRDAKELRVKETDRIAAVVRNLRAMGAEVSEFADGLAVGGPVTLKGASVDSYGDHRIAMAFSIAALLADGETEITNSECVAVSFPEFFECLDSVVRR